MAAQVTLWGRAIYFCPNHWNSWWSSPGEWTKKKGETNQPRELLLILIPFEFLLGMT